MATYQKTYSSLAEMALREAIFQVREISDSRTIQHLVHQASLLLVDAHNQDYLDGSSTFFTRINFYGDLTFEEFAQVLVTILR